MIHPEGKQFKESVLTPPKATTRPSRFDAYTWHVLTVAPQRLAITAKRLRIARDNNTEPEPILQEMLRREGFATFLPVRQEFRKPHRFAKVRDKVERLYPLLPGYLFLGMNDRTPDWFNVFRFDMVQGVLCLEGRPVVIPAREVSKLAARSMSGAFKAPGEHQHMHTHREFMAGDTAELIDGAMAGTSVNVVEIDGAHATIRHMFFGSEREVIVPLEKLAAVE